MVRRSRYVETEKRITEIDWGWAVGHVTAALNQQMVALENNATLDPEVKKLKVDELRKAWKRILAG